MAKDKRKSYKAGDIVRVRWVDAPDDLCIVIGGRDDADGKAESLSVLVIGKSELTPTGPSSIEPDQVVERVCKSALVTLTLHLLIGMESK